MAEVSRLTLLALFAVCLMFVSPAEGYITLPKQPHGPIIPEVPHFPHPKQPHPEKPPVCHRDQGACYCNCNFAAQHPAPHKEVHTPHCEWKLVFKAVKGNGHNVHDDFLNGGDIYGGSHEAQQIMSTMRYRDAHVLDYWDDLHIKQVKIEVFEAGVRKNWFLFDGLYSEISTWMTRQRMLDSYYGDIKVEPFDRIGVTGAFGYPVHFYIMRTYDLCDTDCGYLAVEDGGTGNTPPCSYANSEPRPYFIYGKNAGPCSLFDTDAAGIGDRFVISTYICDEDKENHGEFGRV